MDLQQLEGQLTRWRRSRRHRRRLPEEVWASAVELARTHGLSREEARRLAEAKGLTLPEGGDLSLAELYCDGRGASPVSTVRRIGFA